MTKTVKVCETFSSIQGETTFAGQPCFFIRLSGCNLRCRYCDTKYAYSAWRRRSVLSLVAEYKTSGLHLVEVTGGEPLAQDSVYPLLKKLAKHGETILETNGSFSISGVPDKVITMLDIKCPGSGFIMKNDWQNMTLLRAHDEVKFVVCNRNDYEWSRGIIKKYGLIKRCHAVNMSPAAGFLAAPTLARWVIKDRLPVRLNLQLHKIIWPKAKRGK
ncbi:radical SAM protein [Verrucomicrobiota bacterium]